MGTLVTVPLTRKGAGRSESWREVPQGTERRGERSEKPRARKKGVPPAALLTRSATGEPKAHVEHPLPDARDEPPGTPRREPRD